MPDDFERRLVAALQAHAPRSTTQEGARSAAVLIPVVLGAEPTVIFTRRTDTLPSHKGQISFPGGSIDAGDPSAASAALRETKEEIGLEPSSVRIVGELDTFPTYVTGYVVTPFVGLIDSEPELERNPGEVAEVLHIPLGELDERIRSDPGFSHAGRTYPTEAWVWNDRVIWGVTARIVRFFLELLAGAGLTAPAGPDTWADLSP